MRKGFVECIDCPLYESPIGTRTSQHFSIANRRSSRNLSRWLPGRGITEDLCPVVILTRTRKGIITGIEADMFVIVVHDDVLWALRGPFNE